MENLSLNESKENSRLKTDKLDTDTPISNNKKDNSYKPKNVPVLEEILKSNEDFRLSYSDNTRKYSVKKKKPKDTDNDKDLSLKERRRVGSIKRKAKKNPKKNIIRKQRRPVDIGGTIKVVGKISAKLESLIQRLGQNSANENLTNTRIENKYVMGPKIKAALEKFNKKSEVQSQLIPFHGTKYKSVTIPDSDKSLKNNPILGKIRYIQKINEDKSEGDESEDEEEEEDEEDSENENKNQKSSKELFHSKSEKKGININNKYKSKQKKKERKNNILNLSNEYSSDSENNHGPGKSLKKRKIKKHNKENNSKSLNSEDSDESDKKEEKNIASKIKKRKKNKKGATFDFSESEKSEEKKLSENQGGKIIKRKLERHKSGKATFVMKKLDSRSISSNKSNSSVKSNENKQNSSNCYNGRKSFRNNPININNSNKNNSDDKNTIMIKKKFVKNVEYDKFSYKQYAIKNYHPKPYAIWEKDMKNYILSRQTDFSIITKIKKKQGNKKVVMFNVNNNDFNKRKNNNNRFKARKSVCPTINSNSLLNFAKKFDISKYEEKLSNIKKMKNNLINEKKIINTEFAKRRKRYQSIYLTEDKIFNDFTKKFNNKNNNNTNTNNNDTPFKKNKITNPKNRRMSVFEFLHKRSFNSNYLENLNTEPNEEQNNKKIKFNFKNGTNNRFNKDKSTALDKIQERDEDAIKQTHFGVKYIVFQNKNDLKTIYKQEKWNLSISNNTSIFLKATPKEDINKKKVLDNSKIKNNAELEKIYKNHFDIDNKIEKISLNYTVDKKRENKIIDFSSEDNESSSSKSNSQNNENNNNINDPLKKSFELQNLIKKEENKPNPNEKLFKDFVSQANYDKETKKSDKDILKSVNSGSNINESQNQNDDANYLNNNFVRNYNKNLSMQVRKMKKSNEYVIEEKEKKIGKVKSKKAKIKKFKKVKDEPELEDDERRRKGNLYDYYSSKISKKRKHCLKYENEKDYTINSRNIKNNNDNDKFDFNNSNQKNKYMRRCNSGKNTNKYIKNYSSNKKQKKQINPIYQYGNSNLSLITSYRQRILEGNSNKSINSNLKKNNQNYMNKSISALRRKNEIKIKLNSSKEMQGIESIKSKMKKRLIEINNKLLDAVDYYNGPIDISCISLKNYAQTVEDLGKRALKKGYNCTKLENNYYELSNSANSFLVEIVKIRNNMLYYLIVKN